MSKAKAKTEIWTAKESRQKIEVTWTSVGVLLEPVSNSRALATALLTVEEFGDLVKKGLIEK